MFKIKFDPLKKKSIINPEDLLPKTVENTNGELLPFDANKIIESLIKETGLSRIEANKITTNVLRRISSLGLELIAAPHLRELVCGELTAQGLHKYRNQYTRLGIPIYDVKTMLRGHQNTIEKITSINPTFSHEWIASQVIEQYVHLDQLSDDARSFHLTGRINIDMMRFWDEPICQQWDLRTILIHGIPPVNWVGVAKTKPAQNALTAVSHAAKWFGLIQNEFSGGQGYDNFNTFIAPYLKGLKYKSENPNEIDILQVAQSFIYESNQIFGSIIGRSPDVFICTTPHIPEELAEVEAVGPGGKFHGKYQDYEFECRQFFKALTEVYGNGDADNNPILIPKHEVKLTKRGLAEFEEDYKYVIKHETITMGSTYFVNCISTQNLHEIHNHSIRINLDKVKVNMDYNRSLNNFGMIQNVNINLPRAAYLSKLNNSDIFKELDQVLVITEEILLKKRAIIEKEVRSDIPKLPFCASCFEKNMLEIEKLYDLDKQYCGITITGLNECVKFLSGASLDQSKGFDLGLLIIDHLQKFVEAATMRNNCQFMISDHPTEKSITRFGKLDMKYIPLMAKDFVLGQDKASYHYSYGSDIDNSKENIDLWDILEKQGKLHTRVYNGTNLTLLKSHFPEDSDGFWQMCRKIAEKTDILAFNIK